MQRRIDRAIGGSSKRTGRWDYKLTVHGNRLTAALTFEALPVSKFKDPSYDPSSAISDSEIDALVDKRLEVLGKLLQDHYPNAMIPTLFKNLKKCEHLAKETRAALEGIPKSVPAS
jgi:hypothetical protein